MTDTESSVLHYKTRTLQMFIAFCTLVTVLAATWGSINMFFVMMIVLVALADAYLMVLSALNWRVARRGGGSV